MIVKMYCTFYSVPESMEVNVCNILVDISNIRRCMKLGFLGSNFGNPMSLI